MVCLGCCCLGVLGVVIIYKLLDWLIRLPRIKDYNSRYIFVTGCDTGFGFAAACKLDKLGCHVFAGCLTEKGETELKKSCSKNLRTIPLDVTKPASIRAAFETVKKDLPPGQGLWGVVNNAGYLGPCGQIEWHKIDDYRKVLDVNLLGLIDVTVTFLPLIKKAHGRIVNTASVFGRYALAGATPYSTSKFGVEAFSDILRRQLVIFGCSVHIVEPGFHKTPMTSSQNIYTLYSDTWKDAPEASKEEYGQEYVDKTVDGAINEFYPSITSERYMDVVDAYEHALLGKFPRTRYLVGNDAKFLWMPLQLMPTFLGDLVLAFLFRKAPVPAVLKKS